MAMIEKWLRFRYDPKARAAYLYFRPIGNGEVAQTVMLAPVAESKAHLVNELLLDVTSEGEWLGIELLDVSHLPRELLSAENAPPDTDASRQET